MSFALLFSIVAPLAALLILLAVAYLPPLRPYRRFVVGAGVGLSLVGSLFIPLEPVRVIILSRWQPSVFFGSVLALLAEPEMWLLVLAFSSAILTAVLTQMARVPEPRFYLGLSTLGMLAAGLIGLWGENLLITLIAWAGFDLAWALGAIAIGISTERVVLGVALNGLSTVALWTGALIIEGRGGGLSWRLMDLVEPGGDLLLVAGLLRLGVYPLPLALPKGERLSLPGAAPLLLGPVLGLGLLAHLVAAEGSGLLTAPWLEVVAVATFIGGGILAWTATGLAGGWPWTSLAALGGVVWASTQAGDGAAAVLVAGGAAWTLGVTLLHVDRGVSPRGPWWSIPTLFGGATLLGAPLTGGLLSSAFLTGALAISPIVWKMAAFFVGQVLLTAGVAHRILRPAPVEEPVGPLYTAARIAGLILPLLLLLMIVGLPRLMTRSVEMLPLVRLLIRPGLLGWGLWVGGLLVGCGLFWLERRFRSRIESVLALLHDLFRLDWGVRLLLDSLDRLVAFLDVAADIIEGPGAILWALAIFLLILRIVAGR